MLEGVSRFKKLKLFVVVILQLCGFEETDAMILEFGDELNNAKGSSSVGDNSASRTQPSPTPRRRQQCQLLELKRYVHKNGKILITIALGVEKLISPHVVRFS
ncbi:CACTA en-spm transposon protein [Cucumis melo var. makuwa]|uniref:CACTA en-spm transposon protein n=1 Tax=Cucumis melo var. makuwa TaxID=1194695 RepID=A0A5D3BYY7_CUCMM|nr:CACTA en-spm transposon protein [Cucumis melo var. makuwa]TYK03279.1 CACTA en-spm transposon protein [Cucumis melo var. makuwa]